MINGWLAFIILIISVMAAGLYAGAETGMYQLSRLRTRLGIQHKKWLYILLGKCLNDKNPMLITLLIGTNISHYFATSMAAMLILSHNVNESAAQWLTMIVITPILFLFSELLPKNIFFRYADKLMPKVSPILYISQVILKCTGFSWAIGIISKQKWALSSANSSDSDSIFSTHIRNILRETNQECLLSSTQNDLIYRVSGISQLRLASVMTPITHVQKLDQDSRKNDLENKLKLFEFTRYPVYSHKKITITGYIDIYQCLSSKNDFDNLDEFVHPICKMSAKLTIPEAISKMQKENAQIALVIKSSSFAKAEPKPIGIVTMKDLIEEIVGDLSQW